MGQKEKKWEGRSRCEKKGAEVVRRSRCRKERACEVRKEQEWKGRSRIRKEGGIGRKDKERQGRSRRGEEGAGVGRKKQEW